MEVCIMQISNVDVSLVAPQAGLIGFASLVIANSICIRGIAIHEKRDGSGYRLTYPTRKSGIQSFNICHPITKQCSWAIEDAIFSKLKDVFNQSCNHARHYRYKPSAG